MLKITKILKTVTFLAGMLGLIKCSSLLKMSFIIGTWPTIGKMVSLFSLTGATIPLSGLLGGFSGAGSIFICGLLLRVLKGGFFSAHTLAFHVPGFAASVYWTTESIVFRVGLPLACIVSFILHPDGIVVAPYALFWLIPIGLFFVKQKNIFLHALSSTFIAHAVGSVIWIYTVPMPPSLWYSAMLLVPFERIVLASTTVLLYHVITITHRFVSRFIQEKWNASSCMHHGR